MSKEKIKVYLYTRVSTTMQIDGYSLDAQKTKMKAFCDYNEYEIAGEYEDAGKSGKSIEGRIAFNQMMDDIKSGKDEVSYVLVFKLSRFGRNAADVLATLQVMQDFGVNLICVEDGIDSSKDAGKLMISVLSAVAEIERENIRVQTMEGRMQKAREGKWNGGFAPYGYALILSQKQAGVEVILFTENSHGKRGFLTAAVVSDFVQQYSPLRIKPNLDCHDRLIVLDYGLPMEQAFHCGASSKDAGKKLCAINTIADTSMIHPVVDKLLLASDKQI